MIEKVLIEGIEFPLNPETDAFIDGHVYCKECGEQLDLEPINLLGNIHIFSKKCLCDRKKEEELEKRKKLQHIASLKKSCFKSPVAGNYRFSSYEGEKEQSYTVALNFAKNFEEMQKDNIGLLFYGCVGSGKSFLASCIANYLIEEKLLSVKMRNFAEIINDLQSGGFSLDKNKYIDLITNVPLLILDDLGIERDTSYAKEQVYNVINARYQKQKPTIITTNLSFETIENTKEMEYQRIYSRIIEMCIPVVVVGQDYRKKIKSHKIKRHANSLLFGGEER